MKKRIDRALWLLVVLLLAAIMFLGALLCEKEMKAEIKYENGAKINFTEQPIILQAEAQSPTETATEPPKQPKTIELVATAYCSCKKCCGKWAENRPTDEHGTEVVFTATGTMAIHGRTIAVDPNVIPYGTKLLIKGAEGIPNNVYVAEDCGGAIVGNHIDIYFGSSAHSHEAALEFGVQYVTAEVIE